MKLNEESVKKLDNATAKGYYFWLDDKGRLTLELTDEKDIVECVGITLHTIKSYIERESK